MEGESGGGSGSELGRGSSRFSCVLLQPTLAVIVIIKVLSRWTQAGLEFRYSYMHACPDR